MPRLSRYFIRSALVYLGIGFTIGGLILSAKGGYVNVQVWAWFPMHIVILIVGWLIQLSIGVSYWILPRIYLTDRGRSAWAWTGFAALQIGLALTLVCLLVLWEPSVQGLFAPALILQALGIVLYAVHAWPRIRPAIVRAPS